MDQKKCKVGKKETEIVLSSVLDGLTTLVAVLEPNGDLVFTNNSSLERIGQTLEQVKGKKFYDVSAWAYDKKAQKEIIEDIKRCAAGEKISHQIQIQTTIGLVWIELNMHPIFDKNGKVRFVVPEGRDITEQKRAEEVLKKQNTDLREFKTIINQSDSMVMVWQVAPGDWPILFVSDNVERIIGYSADDLLSGRVKWTAITHPDDVSRLEKENAEYQKKGLKTWSQEYRLITKTGEIKWFHDYNFIMEEVGEKEKLHAIIHDITERKIMEESLVKSEKKYRDIFETTVEGLYQTTPDGRFLSANYSLAKMFGYPSVEELLRSVTNVGREIYTDFNRREEIKKILTEKGIAENFEASLYKKDKSVIWVLINAKAIKDEKGNIVYYQGGMVDITERKKIEEALVMSERKMHAIFDQTFELIGMLNADGVLTEINRAALEFSGIEASSVLNKFFWLGPWWSHSVELQEEVRQAVEKVAKGEFVRFEATHPAKDGTLHYIDFSLKPIKDEKGKVVFMVPEGRDITEQKKAEEKLKEKYDELEKMNKFMIGRELKMAELKRKIEELKAQKSE